MIGTGFALVLAMFVGCGGNDGEKEYEKAVKAWSKGNLVQARALFEKATARLSGNTRKAAAFNKLGQVLWQLDEPQAAAAAFDNACTLSDALTDARLNLALAQFHTGDLDGATKSVNMYLGANPDHVSARALKGFIAARQHDWPQSARLMAEVASASPNDPAAQNALALAELNQGQGSAKAITRLQKITAAYPDYPPALFNLGMIHEQWLHDHSAAIRYYKAYLQQAGNDAPHAAAARDAVARLSDPQQAQSSSTDPVAAVEFMKAGAKLHKEGKPAEAVEQFSKAVQADPGQKNAYYNMALSYYSLKQYDDAAEACQQALRIDSRFADARYMLALSHVQSKRWGDAEREAKELSAVDPKRGQELLAFIAGARK